jgi:TP901 family phage tail tape measure protein
MIVGELFYTLGIKADDIRKVESELQRLEAKFNKGRSIAVKAIGGGDARAEAQKTASSLAKLRERYAELRAEWGQDQRAAGSFIKSLSRIEKGLLAEAAAAKKAGNDTTAINNLLSAVAERRLQTEKKLEAARQTSGKSQRDSNRATLEQAAAFTQGGQAVDNLGSKLLRLQASYDANQSSAQILINGLRRLDAQYEKELSFVNAGTNAHDRLSRQRAQAASVVARVEKDLARASDLAGAALNDETKAMVQQVLVAGRAGSATGQLRDRIRDLSGAWNNGERTANSYLSSLQNIRQRLEKMRDANMAAGKSTGELSTLLTQVNNAIFSTEAKVTRAREASGQSLRHQTRDVIENARTTSQAALSQDNLNTNLQRANAAWASNRISADTYQQELLQIIQTTEAAEAAVVGNTEAQRKLTAIRQKAANQAQSNRDRLAKAADAAGVSVGNLTRAELLNVKAVTPVAAATERWKRELTIISAQITPFNTDLGRVLTRLRELRSSTDAQNVEWQEQGVLINRNSKAYAELQRVIGNIDKRIDQTKAQMLGLSGALRNSLTLSENLSKAWLIGLGPQGYRLFLVTDVLKQSFTSLSGSFKVAQGAAQALLLTATALGTVMGLIVGAGLIAAVGAAIKLDDAFTDVIKTTNFTQGEILQLFGRFAELTREVPLTTQNFLEFARVAGQLGIRGVNNVALFSEAIGELSVATDIVGEEGAQQLARFLQATGTAAANLGQVSVQISNVLNELENSTAASAGQILRVTEFTQALATQANFTRTEILALNSTLVSLGLTAESGGSAIVRIFSDIQKFVSSGSSELGNFAKLTGLTAERFADLVRESPADALEVIVTSLGEAGKAGLDLNAIITNLGIVETRERRAILSLAGGYEQLTKNRRTALREAIRQTSIDAEVGRRSETLSSQLRILRSEVGLMAQAFGIRATPALRGFLNFLRAIVRPMAEAGRGIIGAANAATTLMDAGEQLTTTMRSTAEATSGLIDATSENGLLGAIAELSNTMDTKGRAALAQFALSSEFAELAANDLQAAIGETLALYLQEQIVSFQTAQAQIADFQSVTEARRAELRIQINDMINAARAISPAAAAFVALFGMDTESIGGRIGASLAEGGLKTRLDNMLALTEEMGNLTAASRESATTAAENQAILDLYTDVLAQLTSGSITAAEASALLGERFGLLGDAFRDIGNLGEVAGKDKRSIGDVLTELEAELEAFQRRGTILDLDPSNVIEAQIGAFEAALTELSGTKFKLDIDDSRVVAITARLADARAELEQAQKIEIFQDLAEEGTEAMEEAARQGSTLAATVESIETRTGLLNEALSAISDLDAFGPQSAEAEFLRGRLRELEVELNAILDLQTDIEKAQERQRAASEARFDDSGQQAATVQAFIIGGQPLEELPQIVDALADLDVALADAADEAARWGTASSLASTQAGLIKEVIDSITPVIGDNSVVTRRLQIRYRELAAEILKAGEGSRKAKVDFDPGGIISKLGDDLEFAAESARLFGGRFELAGVQADLVKAAINELRAGGLDPLDTRLQDLIARYEILTGRVFEFAEGIDKATEAAERRLRVKKVFEDLAFELERAGIFSTIFGDAQGIAATKAGILRSGIENLISEGLNPLGAEIRARISEYVEFDKQARLLTASLEKQAEATEARAEFVARRKGRQLETKPETDIARIRAATQEARLVIAALIDEVRFGSEEIQDTFTEQALLIGGGVDPRVSETLRQLKIDMDAAAVAATMYGEENKLAGVQAGILRSAIDQLREDGFMGSAGAIEDLLPLMEALIDAQERLDLASTKARGKLDIGELLANLGANLQTAADQARLFGEEEGLAGAQAALFRAAIETLEPVLGANSPLVQDLTRKWEAYTSAAFLAGKETDNLVDELIEAGRAALGITPDVETENLVNQLNLAAEAAERAGDTSEAAFLKGLASAVEFNAELLDTVEVLNTVVDIFSKLGSIDFSNAKDAVSGLIDVASQIAGMFGPTGQIIAAGLQVVGIFAEGFADAWDLAFTSAEERMRKFGEEAAKNSRFLTDVTLAALAVTREETRWIFPFGPITGQVINEFATNLRISIAESVASGLADALRTGIEAALKGEKDWKKQLEEGVKSTLRNAIITAFIEAQIIAAGVQEFVAEFARLIAAGEFEAAGKLAKEELPDLVNRLLQGLEILLGNLPPELRPDPSDFSPGGGGGGGGTPDSPFTPSTGGGFSLPTASPTIITATPAWVDDLGRLLETQFGRFEASIDRLVDEGITINVNTGGGGRTSSSRSRDTNIIRT